jgi:nucleoside-diphosphate-sugar epimerase
MIIGDGNIAQVLKSVDREDRLFFASGVSNSLEIRRSEYEREKRLLLVQDKNRHLVYFSSLRVFSSDTLYTQHKIRMERLIKKLFKHYTIVRLGNITWGSTNPNTLINFLKNKIKNNEPYEVQDVYRYLVDKEEFLYWISMIPDWPCEINIPGRRIKVSDIVKEIKAGKL